MIFKNMLKIYELVNTSIYFSDKMKFTFIHNNAQYTMIFRIVNISRNLLTGFREAGNQGRAILGEWKQRPVQLL